MQPFPPAGWAVHQLDGGANTWIRYTSSPIFGAASASVRWESASLANDDWLVTPSFLVDAADKLNFYAVGSSTFVDSIIVYASTARWSSSGWLYQNCSFQTFGGTCSEI